MEAAHRAAEETTGDSVLSTEVYTATLHAIETTPARTADGNRAKLAAVVSFYEPDPPETDSILSAVLWDAVCGLAKCSGGPPVVSTDAELIG